MAKNTATVGVNPESLLKEMEGTSKKVDGAIRALLEKKKDVQRRAEQELQEIDSYLERFGSLYQVATGKPHRALGSSGNGHARAEKKVGKATTKGRSKRTRKQGVSAEWVESHLKQPMTLRQLQEKADKDGFSTLSVAAVLKKGKSKFKAAEGERKAGMKGKAPQVWSSK
jgi:hypothetical protein